MKETTKGILFMLAAASLFSTGGIFIKLLPWAGLSINGIRCFISAAVFGSYMFFTRRTLKINLPTLLGAAAMIGTTTFYNIATKLTTAGNAIVLEYTAPVFIILISYFFFKKKPSKSDLIATAAVLFGIFWFFLDTLSAGHATGNFLGLCAGLSCGILYTIKLNPKADLASLTFLGLLASAIICSPSVLTETVFTPEIMVILMFLGIFQLGVGYIFFFQGLSRCAPVPAVLAGSLEPILNPIWVALFYGEIISPVAMPGVIVILGTVLVYNLYQTKNG